MHETFSALHALVVVGVAVEGQLTEGVTLREALGHAETKFLDEVDRLRRVAGFDNYSMKRGHEHLSLDRTWTREDLGLWLPFWARLRECVPLDVGDAKGVREVAWYAARFTAVEYLNAFVTAAWRVDRTPLETAGEARANLDAILALSNLRESVDLPTDAVVRLWHLTTATLVTHSRVDPELDRFRHETRLSLADA